MGDRIDQKAYGNNVFQVAQVLGDLKLRIENYNVSTLAEGPFLKLYAARNILKETLRDYEEEMSKIDAGHWYDGILRAAFVVLALFATGFCIAFAGAVAGVNEVFLGIIWFGFPLVAGIYFVVDHRMKYDIKIKKKREIASTQRSVQGKIAELDRKIENLLNSAKAI